MRLFIQDKYKVIPSPATLLIREFKNVWEKSKDKELALKELGYVYYLSDYKSVYLSSPPEEREESIILDLELPKGWKPDKAVQEATAKYEELQFVPALRFLKAQRHALEELMKYYNNLEYRKIGKPTEVSKAMAESSKVLDSLDKIEERVRKELGSKGRTRGDRELNLFEDPDVE